MSRIYDNILQPVGHTPLVRLSRLEQHFGTGAEIIAKLESFNPGFSVKTRIAVRMIEEAEKRGDLKPGGTIVEGTSGNTGISLAMAAAAKGYRCIMVMPDNLSRERISIVKSFGAEVVLTPGELNMAGAGKKAAELAAEATDSNDFITNVYKYVTSSVTYDREKAANIQQGYIPDPDEIFDSGKGICFDYASLAACMLRSQGIPTQIIFGYVGDSGDLYHAWNMYYTEESGWVAVEFEVKEDEWNRLDLTFSANGTDSEYIGDGTNYLDVFHY